VAPVSCLVSIVALGDADVEEIEEGWCSCVGAETPSVFVRQRRKKPRLLPPCLLFSIKHLSSPV
jgi:hypothetical protein